MGFWVMILSAIVGIILIIIGFNKKIAERSSFYKWALIILGVALLLFAVILGLPH